jgi:ketosteroid isomerase-like protein
MASANVNLVRSMFAAWQRGDFSSTDWACPDMEFVVVDGPSPGRWTGPTGMIEGSRDFLGAWETWRMEADEYREIDDERVLVLVRYRGRGRTSGLDLGELRTDGAALFEVRGGKVSRFVRYFDRERALADLGLADDADAGGS